MVRSCFAVLSVVAQIGEDVEDGAVEHHFPGFDQLVPDGLSEVALPTPGGLSAGCLRRVRGRLRSRVVDLFAICGAVEAEVEAVEGALFASRHSWCGVRSCAGGVH